MSVQERSGRWRRERLARARLYVVTDARRGRADLAPFLEAILGAGTDIVQLREKEAEAADLLRWSEVFRAAAHRHDALFVVNDRADVAVAAGADGVHVGQEDLPVEWVRRIVGDEVLIGLSTHTNEQFAAAPAAADYRCAGPVHATPTKPGRPATGTSLVEFAARHAGNAGDPRPWFAIGGINADTAGDVVSCGAERVVVVRAVTDAAAPADAVRALRAALGAAPSPGT